jgi:hypothetical protein
MIARPGTMPSPSTGPRDEATWHWEDDCPVADLVRAYAELHRQAHGGTVAGCHQHPCTRLAATLARSRQPR